MLFLIYVQKKDSFNVGSLQKATGLSTNRPENWGGGITGDLEREFLINLGNKEKLEEGFGEKLFFVFNIFIIFIKLYLKIKK